MTLRTLLVKLGFKGDVSKLVDFDNKIKGLKTNILGLSAVFATATASLGYFLNEAAKLEQTKIAFEVMTGSIQLGQKLIKDLFTFARTTPFRIPGVLQASKILLAMGVEAENQIDVLTKIGHVAAGVGKPLDQLASIFGRVRAAGYLTGYEMERLRRAGIPLGAYLSELLKKPEKDILQMIRRKEISFEMFAEGWELMVEKRFPNLMDKLLLTFKGIVSNIQDYIYEIVAFSGEELLPVFKLIANQLMYLLDSSRELIGLKFKQFFSGVSNALFLINKGFVKLYFRTRETITQFGGINKLFKIFAGLFGAFIGIKSFALLGRIGKLAFTIFSVASFKLALIGAAILGIFLVIEDLFAYLIGKETVIGDILSSIEKRFPTFHKALTSILSIIKKEIEGLSKILIGLFTLDKEAIMAGVKQTEEAWNKIEKVYEKAIKRIGTKMKGLSKLILGIYTMNPFLIYKGIKELEGKKEEVYTEGMTFTERKIAESKFLSKMAEWTEKAKIWTTETFQPGGAPAPIPIGPQFDRNIIPNLSDVVKDLREEVKIMKYVAERKAISRERMKPSVGEEILRKGELVRKGLGLNINTTINITDLPKNANSREVSQEAVKQLESVFDRKLDNILKAGYSAIEPEQE